MRWSQRDSRYRQGLIVACVLWVFVLGWYFYLVVVGADVPTWTVSIIGTLVGVAVIGNLRWRHVKASVERHKLPMIMLSTLFPPVDRLLREQERRDTIVEANRKIIGMMAQILTDNGLDSSISDGLTSRYVDPPGFAVDRLDVPTFAKGVAAEMSATDTEILLDRPADDVADLLALLYWDDYGGHGGQMALLWKKRGDALVEPLASVLISRLGGAAATVDEGELGTFLRKLPMYGFAEVQKYVDSRPAAVVDRMIDVLGSYAPTDAAGGAANWPVTTRKRLKAALNGAASEADQITTAARFCSGLVSPPAGPSQELLEFLYLRRFDRPRAIDMWRRRSPTLAGELAVVLAAGPQLARNDAVYARNTDCLTEIIEGLVEYSLASVQRIVVELRRHYDCAERVLEFVDSHHRVSIDPLELQHRVAGSTGTGLPTRAHLISGLSDTAVSAAVVKWAVKKAIGHKYPSMAKHQRDVAALVAAGEFTMRSGRCSPSVASTLAREAARANADAMLLAVLVERRYRNPFPDLGVVLGELSLRSLTLDPELVQRIRDRLEVGEWPTEVPGAFDGESTGVDTVELASLSAQLTELHRIVKNMPDERALARVRPLLADGTVLPHDDFDRLYLVMFDSKRGPVGALLDSLSSMTARLKGRLYDMVEPTATGCLEDVCDRADNRYYTFGHYTRYARLGVLPPNETFDEFATNFFDDVNCLLQLTNARRDFRRPASGPILEWEDVEVNLLYLGEPIRYDLYRIGEPGLREHSPLESEELTRLVGEQVLKPMIDHRSPPLRFP